MRRILQITFGVAMGLAAHLALPGRPVVGIATAAALSLAGAIVGGVAAQFALPADGNRIGGFAATALGALATLLAYGIAVR